MIRAVRPSAVARDDASLITGWNIAPNVGYTVSLSVSASAVVVLLADADNSGLIGSGLALVGADQPVTIMPMTGQTIGMVDADLGWHLLVTTAGTEGDRTITIDPMVDLADEIHPIYTDDNTAIARATAAINAGACYVDDVAVTCPLGLGAGIGAVASASVDGAAVVGQIESITWAGTPNGVSEAAVIRRHTPIAPDAYAPPAAPPTLMDDTAETDAATVTSGNVLSNDTGTLTVVAVNGLSVNVGEEIAGSNGGVFTIAADGAWTFDPDGDFSTLSGSDTATTSVSYHASNGSAEASAALMVTVSSADVQLWTPAAITTALWLDAADSSTITLNGSTVSEWRDKSGNARHATQGTAASQPQYNSTEKSIYANADKRILSGVFTGISDGTQNNYAIFAVLTPGKLSTKIEAQSSGGAQFYYNDASNSCFFTGKGSTDPTGPVVPALSCTQNCIAGTDARNALAPYIFSRPNSTSTAKRLVCFIRTATGATSSGVNGEYSNGASSTVINMSWIGYSCPSKYSTASAWAGHIHELMLVFSPLVGTDRQRIEGYLAHKWDSLLGVTTLVDALPSDHPYKSAAPTL